MNILVRPSPRNLIFRSLVLLGLGLAFAFAFEADDVIPFLGPLVAGYVLYWFVVVRKKVLKFDGESFTGPRHRRLSERVLIAKSNLDREKAMTFVGNRGRKFTILRSLSGERAVIAHHIYLEKELKTLFQALGIDPPEKHVGVSELIRALRS